MGAVADHPAAEVTGVVDDSLTRYPVTPTSSVAVKLVIDTVKEVAVAGIVKAVTVGGVVSEITDSVFETSFEGALSNPAVVYAVITK